MTDRAAWLEERRTYIGASDVSALLLDQDGNPINPYRSPLQVWRDKMGFRVFEDNERTTAGLALEPYVCQRFREYGDGAQKRIQLVGPGTVGPKDSPSWHRCNPDKLIRQKVSQLHGTDIVVPDKKGLSAIFQIKTAGYFGAQEFGVGGTDEVPDYYQAQVQWELYCTGRELCVLGLLYDTHIYKQFLVYRHDELIAHLKGVVDGFWNRYIETKDEPPASSHKADKSYLNDAWAPKGERLIAANEQIDTEVDALSRELDRLKRLDAIVEGRKNRIRQYMGDATEMATSLGTVTWKPDKNGRRALKFDIACMEEKSA